MDSDKAASYGISYEDIRQTLYAAYGNAQIATLYGQTNDYQVILEVAKESQRNPADIKQLYVRGEGGKLVQLDAIASLSQTTGPLSVNHQGNCPP